MVPQRDAFWEQVYEIAREDRDVVLITADMGAPSLDIFRRNLPSQFVNVGIAEQNAISIAAGLVLSGKKPFVYAIAPFITLRCLEQIRVHCAIMNLPMTLVGVGVGFGYDDSGPTHHLIEDVAIMRSMPNIKIHSMTDSVMSAAFARIAYENNATNYIRLYRQHLPGVYDEGDDFQAGMAVLKESKDSYIVSMGSMTHYALELSKKLATKGVKVGVIDAYSLPLNRKMLLKAVKKCKKIVVLEEGFMEGGLGSAVSESLIDENVPARVKRFGLDHEKGYCYRYGCLEVIRDYYDISLKKLNQRITEFLAA